jgi:thiamine pyrophosphate-dependent acetolactate synthase large subunit-like protein
MAETVADFPVEPLIEWWVSRIYGYPGGGINGITTALRPGYELAKRRHRPSPGLRAL